MPVRKTPESSLIDNASKGSSPLPDKRDLRYELRSVAQVLSVHQRFKKCGCTAVGRVTLGLKGNLAQQRGLYTCGSIWVCPVCNAKVMTERRKEVEQAIVAWQELGGFFIFETLTVSHRSGDSVAKQRKAIKTAWDAANKGSFKKKHQAFGQRGYVRIAEVTSGPNGEHLHLHVLRFTERRLTAYELENWKDAIFDKWAGSIQKQGLRRPSAKFHDFQQIDSADGLAGYLTKNFANPKDLVDAVIDDKTPGTSIWRLLDVALSSPNSEARQRWNAYERDTFGMNQMTWSLGLRLELGLCEEKTDEELAQENEVFEPIIEVHPESVRAFGKLGRVHSRILRQLELGNLDVVLSLLEEHGIQHTLLDECCT